MAVTLKDVALAAKLHKSTVARAMHNDPRLSLKTREKVQKLARKLGYIPNPLITALMQSRRGAAHVQGAMIACMCDVPGARVPGTFAWLDALHRTIKDRAAHLGFGCEIFYLEDFDWNGHRLLKVLHARGFSGLIWNCTIDHPMVDSPLLSHFAVVTSGSQSRDYSSVDFDECANTQLAVEQALALGYRRPGVLLWQNHPQLALERCRAGFLNAVRNLPADCQIPLLICSNSKEYNAWHKRYRPDILISKIWPIPRHPYLSLDWIPELHSDGPKFSGIDVCRNQAGSVAVDLVASHLYHNERGPGAHARHIYVPGAWHRQKAVIPACQA